MQLVGTIAAAARMDIGGAFRSQVVCVASGVLAAPGGTSVHRGPDLPCSLQGTAWRIFTV